MAELNPRTNLRIIGIPGVHHDQVEADIAASIAEDKKRRQGGLTEAQLMESELATFKTIEGAAGNMIMAKMARLGVPKAVALDPVTYATNPKGDFSEGIMDPVGVSAVYVNRPVDTFDKFSTIAHVVSHLSVRKEVRPYLSQQDKDRPHSIWLTGLEVAGNRKPRASGLEEGMAMLDQVDFFNTYLQVNFPEDYQRRRQLADSKKIRQQVQKQMKEIDYGQISPMTLAPFIVLETHSSRLTRRKKVEANLDLRGLKEYLLARKLCEIVGHSLSPDEHLGPDEAFDKGRELLEKDRLARTQDAHRAIVVALGGDRINQGGRLAKWIFEARAHDIKTLDEAMAMFKYILPKSKPLIEDVTKSPGASAYQRWIESTPPRTIEHHEPPIVEPIPTPDNTPSAAQAETVSETETPPSQAPAEQVPQVQDDMAPKQESRQGREKTPEESRIDEIDRQIRRVDNKRVRAQERLSGILEKHPENEDESAEAERMAIEGFQDEIFRLSTERDDLLGNN